MTFTIVPRPPNPDRVGDMPGVRLMRRGASDR